MRNVWGEALQISIFGESHGVGVGVTVGGLPPGFTVDWNDLRLEMARRAPGQNEFSTPRQETDEWEILSGVFNGKTTGAPLCAFIRNKDRRSGDYEPELPRPGHADYAAFQKYGGYADYRGGGHFSGRLTAALVFAGGLAKQVLKARGVRIYGKIGRIYDVWDAKTSLENFVKAAEKSFPVYDDARGEEMKRAILGAKAAGDSVGGVVACAVTGVPAGLGEPFFSSVESKLASMLFSIPAVKAVEFGDGAAFAGLRGSEANDPLTVEDGEIRFLSNHNGGINGGITNGMPILFGVTVKPTSSIEKPQATVNLTTKETACLKIKGRHDPCIVLRAVPVVEAAAALCLLDLFQITKI